MRRAIIHWLRGRRRRAAISALYERIAVASRAPALYAAFGVPDTAEGRFEALALHAILVLRRLRALPPPAADVAQDLVDTIFAELDLALRETGVGDLSVAKRIKPLAKAFYGRAARYDAALDAARDDALAAALGRNVLGTDSPAPRLAAYARAAERLLAARDLDAILGGEELFPDPARPGEDER